ncbi:MAG: hypothetical protein EI684_19960 [Candidatus Viridilinea halotolerans]|uniref:Uncharacterized protein n=1 Tax=Candidatus Viridilinea halotolerans TaxID=2491704 RepID=A0A426TSF6_9CHLR|nr:MAG: hypothetical protein EI684_19960 [Candidatus Viridilinea halotolerans]
MRRPAGDPCGSGPEAAHPAAAGAPCDSGPVVVGHRTTRGCKGTLLPADAASSGSAPAGARPAAAADAASCGSAPVAARPAAAGASCGSGMAGARPAAECLARQTP